MQKDCTDTLCIDYHRWKSRNFLKGIFHMMSQSFPVRTTLSETIKSLKADCEHKAALAKKFVDEITSEILEPLRTLLSEHKARQKQTDATWNTVETTYQDKKLALERSKAAYFTAYHNFDEGIQSFDGSPDRGKMSPEKRRKLQQRITQLLITCKNGEKEYTNTVYVAKDARIEYIKGLSYVLDMHQRFEEDRLGQLQEKLRMYYAKSVELHKQKMETEAKYGESVEKISAGKEVEKIVAAVGSSSKKIDDIVFTRAKSKYEDIIEEFSRQFSKGDSIANFNFEDVLNQKKIDETDSFGEDPNGTTGTFSAGASPTKLQRTLKGVLADCWNSTEHSAEKLAEFKEIIKTVNGRKLFSECLNFYRTQGLFSIPPKAFNSVAGLLKVVLDETQKADDIESALRMLILSQTYYTEITGKSGRLERVYIQQSIQSHPIWAGKEFWEKAIRAGIQEEKEQIVSHKESEAERDLRIQSSVFGKLGTFAHNMVQFGILQEAVETIIFAHAKENGLGPEFVIALKVRFLVEVENKRKKKHMRSKQWNQQRKM